MRERELERAEMAKISLQADRAESALSQLKKEATQVFTYYSSFFYDLYPTVTWLKWSLYDIST